MIKVWDYDVERDQVIAGTDEIIVDGGVDISQEPIWIEAPHIYKRYGKYYLMCAEGGTGSDNYQFSYTVGDGKFEDLGGTVSGDILSTDVAGGFTGAMIGLYATTSNDIKPNK